MILDCKWYFVIVLIYTWIVWLLKYAKYLQNDYPHILKILKVDKLLQYKRLKFLVHCSWRLFSNEIFCKKRIGYSKLTMTEFYNLGAHCYKCKTKDFLPFKCDLCNHVFCLEHRTYEAHNCTEIYKIQVFHFFRLTSSRNKSQFVHCVIKKYPSIKVKMQIWQ